MEICLEPLIIFCFLKKFEFNILIFKIVFFLGLSAYNNHMKGYLKSRKDENPEIPFLRVHPKIVQSFKKLVVVL